MQVLLDTDAVSLVLRSQEPPSLLEHLAELAPEDKFVSAMTVQELLYGLRRRPGLRHLELALERLLSRPGIVLGFDLAAARICADLAAELEGQGTPLALPDLVIAATSLANGLDLVTGNVRHFARVPGLNVCDWLSH